MTQQSSGRRGLKIVLYSLLRLLFFAVPLVVLLYVGLNPYYSAICAALIGFALSLLLLQRQRDPLVELVQSKSTARQTTSGSRKDEDFEDSAVAQYHQEQAERSGGDQGIVPKETLDTYDSVANAGADSGADSVTNSGADAVADAGSGEESKS